MIGCPQAPLEETPPSVLAALAHGFEQRDEEPSEPTHKIRVDFKVGEQPHHPSPPLAAQVTLPPLP